MVLCRAVSAALSSAAASRVSKWLLAEDRRARDSDCERRRTALGARLWPVMLSVPTALGKHRSAWP